MPPHRGHASPQAALQSYSISRAAAHAASSSRKLPVGLASQPFIAAVSSARSTLRTSSLIGPTAAGAITLRFVVTVAAAHLLTLTTAVDELVALVERIARPLHRVGLPEGAPERLGLLVGLTVAAVAALTRIAEDVGEAARARGMERSVTARLVPLVVRAVRHADELGEALAARGVGDR